MKDTTEVYFADTYALIEIIKGNPHFRGYLNLVTTLYNLAELYYHCLHDHSPEVADFYLDLYTPFLVPITPTSIQLGMQLKLQYKHEKLSYVDCLGYAVAKELGIPFLTGDQKFNDKENVEFMK